MNKTRNFIVLLSSALWLVTGCVSETVGTVSDRVFDRAVEQFILMDSHFFRDSITCNLLNYTIKNG